MRAAHIHHPGMGSSGQAETDDAGQSGAATSACYRRYVVVRAWAAWRRQYNTDIGKADIGVEIDTQAERRNPSIPI